MVFSDLFFLFVFIPAFALCYLTASWVDKGVLSAQGAGHPRFTFRNITLVIFSLLFYAWGEAVYVLLMLLCVGFNYGSGLLIERAGDDRRRRKMALTLGLALNLVILGIFKYLGFFCDSLASVGLHLDAPRLSLPIGISFYIFQSISYLVDVYRRTTPVQRNFMHLLLYISMFPQLIAGPIVRYGTVAHEINDRHVTAQDFAEGSYRFLIGLGKKVILANMLSEISSLFLSEHIADLSCWGALIGVLAFTLQIYFDFSGYSDMAIGMGRCMGFHFCENFNHPYCCTSVTDFWRRWHMSLGSFFRDYVYIPLGGNRRHQMLNLLTVWFLTGMWHGASWNFIIWGLYFGMIVAIEKYTIIPAQDRIPRALLRLYSLVVVVIGWGIFYFDDFGHMQQFFASLAGLRSHEFGLLEETALWDNFWLWLAAILFCMPVRRIGEKFLDRWVATFPVVGSPVATMVRVSASVILLLLSVVLLVGATNNAFIYTRF